MNEYPDQVPRNSHYDSIQEFNAQISWMNPKKSSLHDEPMKRLKPDQAPRNSYDNSNEDFDAQISRMN